MVRKIQYRGRVHYLAQRKYLLTKTELTAAKKRYRAKFGYRKKAVLLGGDLLGSTVIFPDKLVLTQVLARKAKERWEMSVHTRIKKKAATKARKSSKRRKK